MRTLDTTGGAICAVCGCVLDKKRLASAWSWVHVPPSIHRVGTRSGGRGDPHTSYFEPLYGGCSACRRPGSMAWRTLEGVASGRVCSPSP